MDPQNPGPTRRLIEEWLPIGEIGVESLRERTPMTPYPAPNRLHVWFARRPLIASRAALLASMLPADADREKFVHVLGIHGDPLASRRRIDEAKRTGERFEGQAYTYRRAFTYSPSDDDHEWIAEQAARCTGNGPPVALDSTAGGGSIPFEALRLRFHTIANDLNPVAWLVLKATVEFPAKFGRPLLQRYEALASEFVRRRDERLQPFIPPEPDPDSVATNWLWARTITCPYCAGRVPLSPNWKLDGKGTGVRLVPRTDGPAARVCEFEIVDRVKDHSPGTVKGGVAVCPFTDCGRVIDGDEHIKTQAQAGEMSHQLYAVVYKRTIAAGTTKGGKPKYKSERGFRAPRPADEVTALVLARLEEKQPEWQSKNIYPGEQFLDCYRRNMRDCIDKYGFNYWTDFFSPRQLLGHCTNVEIFHELVEEMRNKVGDKVSDLDKAALTYLAIALDKLLNYNAVQVRWIPDRGVVAGVFDRHDFSFKWSYAELASTTDGVGYDWAIEQTRKALAELVEMACPGLDDPLLAPTATGGDVHVGLGSGDALDLVEASVDCVVIDPPYYDNVTYSELSDFFYVWLKRTAGLLYPAEFAAYLTNKDREAIANPFRFRGQPGAKDLAGLDYQERMAAIFRECRRVLKPDGIMTVMFTHKASGAWDALATGLVEAGFVITASWPINTEAEGSLHIKEKSAAKSTIFLVCRVREGRGPDADPVYWEEVEPSVEEAVRRRIGEFQAAGVGGIDLYLASFGPALQVFSEHWPLSRGRPITRADDAPNGKARRRKPAAGTAEADPYAVRPEDALDAARRVVKQWRLDQLATVRRRHNLDPLTEWFVLAWDAFKAPKFPVDEALKLARVVGLDFDRQVKGVVCEAKGSDVALWDGLARLRKNRLGGVGGPVALDTLHHCAALARERDTGAALAALEAADLLGDPTLMTALEALLNVLPPPALAARGKAEDGGLPGASADFDALERLRRLAFAETVPPPKVQLALPLAPADGGEEDGADDQPELGFGDDDA